MKKAQQWIIAITVLFGSFMAVMDVSVVNVALPHMMGSFSQDLSAITWVATSYTIAEIILVTMSGWLSTLIGRKRLYLYSFILFTIGSILCGMATSFPMMIFFRILQGIGGGALIPVAQSILRETFSDEDQGMAMAIFGMGVVLAPAVGPILGGWLTDNLGWPWIFYINLPICIVGIFMAATYLKDPDYLRRGIEKIDWLGIFLLTASLTCMQIVLERGHSKNWFDSPMIVWGTIITCFSTVALIVWELKVSEPIINLRVLKNIPLTVGSLMGGIFGLALFGTTFILPQFTQQLLGYSACKAGLVLAPRALALLLLMPVAGKLLKYVNPRWLLLFGILVIFWSYWDLYHLSLDIGYWDLFPMLIIMGAGMPFVFVTTTTVALSTIDRADTTDASSIYTLTRRVGGNIAYAIVATLLAHGQQVHREGMLQHINVLNPNFNEFYNRLTSMLSLSGYPDSSVKQTAFTIVNYLLDRQAAIMAYNDVSMILGIIFIVLIPFLLLVPAKKLA